ncbi:RNA polymerase sigma factor [Rhizobium sp. Root482]|uniref:RNA polymerase sigma factor n=1 Tax=Rhizobium sp. Root482 TaxID=1736543 RepID=UPI0006FB5360|nr:RNA polymerase sigma factor [Rhizobium sp. Root482]KQY13968.1 RNA polymerase subunit sigma [Rhizobium sp. Root482]
MKQHDPAAATAHRLADIDITDGDLLEGALRNEPAAFRAIMARHNQRLFRIARGVVRDDGVAEDVVQEAYLRAFRNLDKFRAEASLSTWLHRIVLNEALGRLRKAARQRKAVASGPIADILQFPYGTASDDPEKTMAQRQILKLVEDAMDELPDHFRMVFIARVIEGMSVEETAALLGIKPETARTRLHRARVLLRRHIDNQIGPVLLDAFPFAGWRCERLTAKVMNQLGFKE